MRPVSLLTPDPAESAPPPRRRLFDNPRLIGIVVFILVALLVVLFLAAPSTEQLRPEFISDVVRYALSPIVLLMLAALAFVLARNILKLWVERRRALPFARFRAKLVAALLAMTIIPSVLVLIIGSEMITSSAQRWFSTPAEELVTGANEIAQIVYTDRANVAVARAQRLASTLAADAVAAGDLAALQPLLASEVA
ncbi:MAG: hypothetical protein B7X11_04180, partial [Acidobacteria bacterium 37-65-4]